MHTNPKLFDETVNQSLSSGKGVWEGWSNDKQRDCLLLKDSKP